MGSWSTIHRRVLYAVFFLSGCSALIFETIWFRLAGQMLGNSIWASSVVLAGFMGGLALGNALAAKHGHRLTHPIRYYAWLEIIVALAGISLVLAMPHLNNALTPLFQSFLDRPWVLNPLRLTIAFTLLLVPTTAMGVTLPILIRGLCAHEPSFGRALGMLYGFNTLGAVAGALAGEFVLIETLGLRGAGWIAAGANVFAAVIALRLQCSAPALPSVEATGTKPALNREAKRLLAAAFLCGFALMALEVLWFRFLSQFMLGSSSFFAIMLAVVLAGIALGGLVAGGWLKRSSAHRHSATVATVCGGLVIVTYVLFVRTELVPYINRIHIHLLHGMRLMLPAAFLSGVLFTLIGQRLQLQLNSETRSGGLLTLANTIGAMLGALSGGFLLLPNFGVGTSIFIVALIYAVVALLLAWGTHDSISPVEKLILWPTAAVFALMAIYFPFGMMRDEVIPFLTKGFTRVSKEKIVEVREGLNETIIYTRADYLDQPYYYRLITNGYFMSGTGTTAKRYMKAFVYLPVALHPDPRRALLISYGVGMTAKALTDTSWIESIDVVDISRDILDLNTIVFPNPDDHPLEDTRVRVHIEDGRFFLQETDQQFDLITGEPPPPKAAGIGNLYSREYFQLMYDRLAPGGMASYWLPVYQLTESDSRAILRAFADVFDDCSLWSGAHAEWIMLGVKPGGKKVSEAQFERQWKDSVIGPTLRAVGFETPAQLASSFIAGRAMIDQLTRSTPPLTDNYPLRLSPFAATAIESESEYVELWKPQPAHERFMASDHIARLWPKSIRTEGVSYFKVRQLIHDGMWRMKVGPTIGRHEAAYRLLTETDLRTAVLWQYQTDVDKQHILDQLYTGRPPDGLMHYNLAVRAMADREYDVAAKHFNAARKATPNYLAGVYDELFALCMTDRVDEAQQLADSIRLRGRPPPWVDVWWKFAEPTFGLRSPAGAGR